MWLGEPCVIRQPCVPLSADQLALPELNVQTNPDPSQASHWFRAAVPPVVLATTSLAMLAWTWGTWPDVLIDFGRELYIAWQLAAGKTLYADIPYFHGPLSPCATTRAWISPGFFAQSSSASRPYRSR